MTTVDLSEEFVAELKQAAVQKNVQLEVVHADMPFLPLDLRFDGAFCFGNSFGYMAHGNTLKLLGGVSRRLTAGGNLLSRWVLSRNRCCRRYKLGGGIVSKIFLR